MDSELRRLERQRAAAPGAAADGAYARALARAGQGRAAYRFQVRCDRRWEDLEPRPGRPFVRRCGACARDVHFVARGEDLAGHVAAGRCVAVVASALEEAADELARDVTEAGAGGANRRLPCLVEGSGTDALRAARGVRVTLGRAQVEPDGWRAMRLLREAAREDGHPSAGAAGAGLEPADRPGWVRRTWRKLFGGGR